MAIKLEMLNCFAAVAHAGSLRAAASQLGRTPSAVSMTLSQLEEHLDAPLFESSRKNRLTPLGEYVFDEARKALDQFEAVSTNITRFARSGLGLVRVAAVPSVAESIMPQVVRRFVESFPDVRIELRDMDSASIIRELARERIDIGIGSGIGVAGEIHSEPLFSDPFGVVALRDHPLTAKRGALGRTDIQGYPIITNGLMASARVADFEAIISRSTLLVRNTTSLLALVRAGTGITLLPRLALPASYADLVLLPFEDPPHRQIRLLRQGNGALAPAATHFCDEIKRVFALIGPHAV